MHVGKKALHFGLLVFTAFWLIATSAPKKPARDCFVPLKRDTIAVTLGAARPPAGVSPAPSCQGIDGLGEGSVLRARLSRGATPPEVKHGACWSYNIERLEGPSGLSYVKSFSYEGSALFEVEAVLKNGQCMAQYRLALSYDGHISDGKPVNVIVPAKNDAWYVRRRVSLHPGEMCRELPKLPNDYCEDVFEVRGVTYAP